MKKKLLLALSLMVLLVCLFAISVSAEDMTRYIEFKVLLNGETEYTTVYTVNTDHSQPILALGNDFYTSLDQSTKIEDKTQIVKIDMSDAQAVGSGKTQVHSVSSGTATAFANVTEIKLPNYPGHYSTINSDMFEGWTSLASVDFGSASTIKKEAFKDCISLTSVTIPETITLVEDSSFNGCTSIASVTVLGATKYASNVFYGCTNLETVSLGSSTNIGGAMFAGCSKITAITIPETVTSIGKEAFKGTSLTEINVPAAVTELGEKFVADLSSLTKVTIPENSQLKTIGSSAFANTGITEIYIPTGVTTIKGSAFTNTMLVSVTLPDTVTTVESGVFQNCSELTSVVFSNNATSIGDNCFRKCPKLTSVTNATGATTVGNYAFHESSALTTIEVDFSKMTSIGTQAFWNRTCAFGNIDLSNVTSIGSSAFNGCTGITGDLDISKATNISGNAFEGCTGITSVVLKAEMTIIYGASFKNCTSLKSINIPDSVKQIYGDAFYGCTALETVSISDNSQLYDIGANAFRNCTSLTSINLVDSIYKIGNDAFHNAGLTYVKLPNGIATNEDKFVGYNTFQDCTKLTTIDFSNCPMTSFPVAFAYNCDGLRYLSLPEGVISLSYNCFDGCDNLEAVYMPDSIETLGIGGWNNGSFANCPKLYFVNEPITPVANYADFVMPEKPLVYYMPTSLKSQHSSLDQSAGPFVKCKNLNTYLVFPEGFTNFFTNDNWFKFCGSEDNPINIVCLGDMTDLYYNTASWDRTSYISYYFMNENDKSIDDVNVIDTNAKAQAKGAYLYFCHGDCRYQIPGNSNTFTKLEYAEGETHHVHNPRADKTTPADCVNNGSNDIYCFCTQLMGTEVIEALGHDYTLKAEGAAPEVYAWYYVDDNFFGNATEQHKCLDCEALYDLGKEIANTSLFVAGGYSIPEQGTTDCISHTIMVNEKNIELYEQHTNGAKINYGTVAAAGSALGTPIEIDEEGNVTPKLGALIADMTGTDYVKLVIKISGIPLDTEALVNCNAYIVVGKEIYYVCGSEVLDTAKEQKLGITA